MGGKGDLIITGQLGEVMRESAVAALSYIRSRAEELQIDPNFLDTMDLHIHMPENALPKDGPSAGITIATALISALTGRHIRGGLAMTGEITLRGRVLGIGGLKEKVLAAHAANIYHLLIPSENKKDLAEIPAKVRQRMHFTIVDTMDQVIEAALLDIPPSIESRRIIEEQTPAEPIPLFADERKEASHEQIVRRPVPPDEENENQTNEYRHDPLLMPPADHRITGNPYPQIQAHD
jgi:ATP-dependent Lon protease